MSKIGRQKVIVPSNTSINIDACNVVTVKGPMGELKKKINCAAKIQISNREVSLLPIDQSKNSNMQLGTARSLINNMIFGASKGFEQKLELVGVGYRAKSQGTNLNMTLGFSHTIVYRLPEGVSARTPSQTEIILKSANKELLTKVASNIRNYRKPEVYKGKGIRYSDEKVITKEAKKK